MINFCVFKWKPEGLNLIPSQEHLDYGKVASNHVNIMFNMVKRHLHIPHRFICITDDNKGLDSRIEAIPLWNDLAEMGGCYKRLKLFSKEMKTLIGDRIVQCDIDTVIVNDITPLIDIDASLIVYQHDQHVCNGSFWVNDAGSHSYLWEDFDPVKSPILAKHEIGTDQGWLKYKLREKIEVGDIPFVSSKDGLLDYRLNILQQNNGVLPSHAKLISFAGPRDPSDKELYSKSAWIEQHWK